MRSRRGSASCGASRYRCPAHGFLTPLRPVAVGLGVLAAYALVVVRESIHWRSSLGAHVWRALHSVSYVAFALATTHGLLAGTDALRSWSLPMYAGSSALVVGLTVLRMRPVLARAWA
jgi:predicted ferric reductase